MACSVVTASNRGSNASNTTSKGSNGHSGSAHPAMPVYGSGMNTGREFGELSPAEREAFLNDIELDFRKHLAENRTTAGFVFYPSTRQILGAISALYETLTNVDLSDAFE